MPQQSDAIERSSATAARRRSMAIWIWSSLLIAAAVMLTHRTSGDLFSTSPLLVIVSTAIVAIASWVATVLVSDTAKHPPTDGHRAWIRVFPKTIAIIVTAVWGLGSSVDSGPLIFGGLTAILFLHGLAVILIDQALPTARDLKTAIAVSPHFRQEHVPFFDPSDARQTLTESPAACELDANAPDPTIHDAAFEEAALNASADAADDEPHMAVDAELIDDDSQTLWLSRRMTDDGELIEGWIRIQFAEGQRETLVHVSFCPPLSGNPELETEDLDGAGLEIRVAAVFPFGARISVRRNGQLDERHLDRVGFIAHSLSNRRAA
ncbi:MAG: hypothetical protein U0941_10945 [Planctomycetaceae bacterium]